MNMSNYTNNRNSIIYSTKIIRTYYMHLQCITNNNRNNNVIVFIQDMKKYIWNSKHFNLENTTAATNDSSA